MRNNRKRFERIVSAPGSACEFGCVNPEIFECIKYARKNMPEKGVCLVKHWMILDCVHDFARGSRTKGKENISSLLYGGNVLFDSPPRFSPGRRILTSPLIALESPGFFITANTVYLLIGQGSRKKIKSRTIGFE